MNLRLPAGTAGVLAFLVLAWSMHAAAQSPTGSLSGFLMDTLGRPLGDKELAVINVATRATEQTRSDQSGRFALSALGAGTYELEGRVFGFVTRYRVTLKAGERLERDVALQVGSVRDTIILTNANLNNAPVPAGAEWPPYRRDTDPCLTSGAGGCLRLPLKTRQVPPQYPEGLTSDVTVRLEGRIGSDGWVRDLRSSEPVDAAFERRVKDAVAEWQYVPARLNGVPVECGLTVTVIFQAR